MEYIHEWQRPTLEGIIRQGFADIDKKIEELCKRIESPSIKIASEESNDKKIEKSQKDAIANYYEGMRNITEEERILLMLSRIRNEQSYNQAMLARTRNQGLSAYFDLGGIFGL